MGEGLVIWHCDCHDRERLMRKLKIQFGGTSLRGGGKGGRGEGGGKGKRVGDGGTLWKVILEHL